ncbi:helix-turn-helix domain-containing protein [Nocardia colli]|uniref:helix-turn-helix domain-containing protein n=1 Tax=Nocardia colli TaxID=2545717 RepID=UPI0035D57251
MGGFTMAWLTTADAATHTKCSRKTIERAARAGLLRGIQRTGKRGAWRFLQEDVDAWMCGSEPITR